MDLISCGVEQHRRKLGRKYARIKFFLGSKKGKQLVFLGTPLSERTKNVGTPTNLIVSFF